LFFAQRVFNFAGGGSIVVVHRFNKITFVYADFFSQRFHRIGFDAESFFNMIADTERKIDHPLIENHPAIFTLLFENIQSSRKTVGNEFVCKTLTVFIYQNIIVFLRRNALTGKFATVTDHKAEHNGFIHVTELKTVFFKKRNHIAGCADLIG